MSITLTGKDEKGNPIELVLSVNKKESKPIQREQPKEIVEIPFKEDKAHCPNCDKRAWDNRARIKDGTFSAKSPHFACSDKTGCGWAVWNGQYKINGQIDAAKEIFDV